jgi:hypothetical protein
MMNVSRDTDTLFFDIVSPDPKVSYDTTSLFIDETVTTNLRVAYNTKNLFFDIRDFDASFPIYKVLLDFIEAMSFGDLKSGPRHVIYRTRARFGTGYIYHNPLP